MEKFPHPLMQCEWVEVKAGDSARRGWGRDFWEACSIGGLDPDEQSIEGRDTTIVDMPEAGSNEANESELAARGVTEFWLSSTLTQDLEISGVSPPAPAVIARLRALMDARLYGRALLYAASAIFDAEDESVGRQVCPGCTEPTIDPEATRATCSECTWTE
jgi:hypothetical protein